MSTTPVPKERRKIHSILLGNVSDNVLFNTFSICAFLLCALYMLLFSRISDTAMSAFQNTMNSNEWESWIYSSFADLKILVPLSLLFLCAFAIFIQYSVSKRRQGEMGAIIKQIRMLKEGDYKTRRNLRKSDEMHGVMHELHALAEKLGGSDAQQ